MVYAGPGRAPPESVARVHPPNARLSTAMEVTPCLSRCPSQFTPRSLWPWSSVHVGRSAGHLSSCRPCCWSADARAMGFGCCSCRLREKQSSPFPLLHGFPELWAQLNIACLGQIWNGDTRGHAESCHNTGTFEQNLFSTSTDHVSFRHVPCNRMCHPLINVDVVLQRNHWTVRHFLHLTSSLFHVGACSQFHPNASCSLSHAHPHSRISSIVFSVTLTPSFASHLGQIVARCVADCGRSCRLIRN